MLVIETIENCLVLGIEIDSHFDGYKRSQGIIKCSGFSHISEYYERPVLSISQFESKEGIK